MPTPRFILTRTKNPALAGERDTMTYHETTQERFDDMLGVLPPKAYHAGGFLVGEPVSYQRGGETFDAYFEIDGHYLQADDPMTVSEFLGIKDGEVRL